MSEKKTATVSMETLQATLNYLQTRPFNEVFQLINALSSEVNGQQQKQTQRSTGGNKRTSNGTNKPGK